MPIKYYVTHTTRYNYQQRVSCGQNMAWLVPKQTPNQVVKQHKITLAPETATPKKYQDIFGNHYYYFSIEKPHLYLSVTAKSEVVITPLDTDALREHELPWEAGCLRVETPEIAAQPELIDIRQFCFPSPLVGKCEGLDDFYKEIFVPNRPLIECCFELTTKIYRDFTYKSNVTDVTTTVDTVYEKKAGVCQDFAHFAIACLRELGLAARYVSGYIENRPAPGVKKLRGSDASHAWFGVYVPEIGWVDFDPTNNCMPSTQHIVLAHGRDYSDVPPLKGVIVGSGIANLHVAVDVDRRGS